MCSGTRDTFDTNLSFHLNLSHLTFEFPDYRRPMPLLPSPRPEIPRTSCCPNGDTPPYTSTQNFAHFKYVKSLSSGSHFHFSDSDTVQRSDDDHEERKSWAAGREGTQRRRGLGVEEKKSGSQSFPVFEIGDHRRSEGSYNSPRVWLALADLTDTRCDFSCLSSYHQKTIFPSHSSLRFL